MMFGLRSNRLSRKDLETLATVIAAEEEKTAGEIRVIVQNRRRPNERSLSVRDLALQEFFQLGMDKTRDHTGVLILLLMHDHEFQIIADEGINAKVPDGTWETIAAEMGKELHEGHIVEGIAAAIRAIGATLTEHFPRKPDDRDELPDTIIQR